eukprot:c34905_g1_i1 orf=394-1032(-)
MAEALCCSSLPSLSFRSSSSSALPRLKSSFLHLPLSHSLPFPSLAISPVLSPPPISSVLSPPPSPDRQALQQFVKDALPGGLAAQPLLGTGRRKCAVARVCLVEGSGKIIINGRTAQDYLQGNPYWLQAVKLPLASLGYETKYDTIVKAEGGGLSGQAQAILLGIARALCVANPANRVPLAKQRLLTRDARRVERKKYSLHKARKAPQYSKR